MSDAQGLSGWWQDKIHHLPLRVYYADTDAAGVVYHATYLHFAEQARTEMIRLFKLDPEWSPSHQGMSYVVRACEIDYKRPAKLDDLLLVRSKFIEIGGASFRVEQEICRGDVVLVGVTVTVVCVRDIGHPTRIPGPLRTILTEYLS